MKTLYAFIAALMLAFFGYGQEETEADTTRVNLGKTTIIIVENEDGDIDVEEVDSEDPDADPDEFTKRRKKSEAHWAGVDFGFNLLTNGNFENQFPANPQWKNDAAKSQVWNLNVLEHKFNFGTPYVGLTTGLGFNWTSVAFDGDYILMNTDSSLTAMVDTVNAYSKNKLKASYLTVPLLLEFNTNVDSDRSFYLAAGVVGGVRMTSKVKRVSEVNGEVVKEKVRGRYGLNPFKLDAAVRLGYGHFGVFANYSLLPLFDTQKTVEVYPFTFGLSLNF